MQNLPKPLSAPLQLINIANCKLNKVPDFGVLPGKCGRGRSMYFDLLLIDLLIFFKTFGGFTYHRMIYWI